jgi:TolB protein
MRPDGSDRRLVIRNGTGPAWSPDRSKLAFSRRAQAGGFQLFVAKADGSEERLLHDDGGSPTWSPNGRQIVFVGMDIRVSNPDGSARLYPQIALMNADGSAARRITNDTTSASWGRPSWSPAGTQILYSSRGDDDEWATYVMNTDGTEVRRLADSSRDGAWSPDGHHIVFVSNRSGADEIYVMNADGTGPRQLTVTNRRNLSPTWSPDGDRIAFAEGYVVASPGRLDGFSHISVVNADGTGLKVLTQGDKDYGPAW